MTNTECNLLLMHVLGITALRKEAAEKATQGLFDSVMSPHHHLIWTIVQDMWRIDPEEEPTQTVIASEIESRTAGQHQQQDRADALLLLEGVKNVKKDELMKSMGEQYLNTALVERTKSGWLGMMTSLYTTEDMNKFISGANADITLLKEEQTTSLSQPLMNPTKYLYEAPKRPTGMMYLDEVAGGGLSPGEVVGFLGPTGGGKTTLAVQLMTAQAKRREHVLLATYEQPPEGDIMERICVNMLNISVNEIRGIPFDKWPAELAQRYQDVVMQYAPYIHTKDMTTKGKEGSNGMQDIRSTLEVLKQRNQLPNIVIIDWFLPMVKRYLAKNNMAATSENVRSKGYDFIDEAGMIAREYEVTIWINHQLTTEMSRANPKKAPKATDAMEFRSFAFNMDACFLVGNRDRNTNIAIFLSDKNRRNGVDRKLVKLNGEFCRFEEAVSYVQDKRGNFVNTNAVMPTGDDEEEDIISTSLY